MSLDVNNFNLFAKKPQTNKQAPKPMPVAATNQEVVAEEIKKFDAEVETITPATKFNNTPSINPVINTTIEIERFEDVRPAPVMNTMAVEKMVSVPERSMDKLKTETSKMKYESFVPLTFRITETQDLELKKIEHMIMRNRKKGVNSESRERITTNTVVRALIANFLDRAGDLDLSNIDNEEMLKERMEKVFKQKYTKRA